MASIVENITRFTVRAGSFGVGMSAAGEAVREVARNNYDGFLIALGVTSTLYIYGLIGPEMAAGFARARRKQITPK